MLLPRIVLAALWVSLCWCSVAAAQVHHPPEQESDPRGDLALEVAGGFGGAVLGGLILVGVVATGPCGGSDCVNRIIYAALLAVVATPLLSSGGVTLAGHSSGGRGSYGASLFGFVGLVPGIAWIVATQAHRHSPINTNAGIGFGIGLLVAGYVTGAVFGYRLSAATTTDRYFAATLVGALGLVPGVAFFSAIDDPGPNEIGLGVGLLAGGYLAGALLGYHWFADDLPRPSFALTPDRRGALVTLNGNF